MKRTVLRTAPNAEPIVAQHNRRVVYRDVHEIIYAGPSFGIRHPFRVIMVSDDQMLLAVEPVQILIVLGERKITKVVHEIGRSYCSVPPLDQGLIHFLNRAKGPLSELDDLGMSEMMVRGKPNHLFMPPTAERQPNSGYLKRVAYRLQWWSCCIDRPGFRGTFTLLIEPCLGPRV
jgi:hypothetical protein